MFLNGTFFKSFENPQSPPFKIRIYTYSLYSVVSFALGWISSAVVRQGPGAAGLQQGGRERQQGPTLRQQGGAGHQPADDGST